MFTHEKIGCIIKRYEKLVSGGENHGMAFI